MTRQRNWALRGIYYECCRSEGQCPLIFRRDLWGGPCTNFATYQVTEGHIQNVDMKGITIIHHQDGLGPKYSETLTVIQEGAVYISDDATNEQRKILAPFVIEQLGANRWRKSLGVKFVKIEIGEENGTFHIQMPFGEQKLTLTVGSDGKNPMRMENPKYTFLDNYRFCNTQFWSYHDYGKNLEFHDTSGAIADFTFQGD